MTARDDWKGYRGLVAQQTKSLAKAIEAKYTEALLGWGSVLVDSTGKAYPTHMVQFKVGRTVYVDDQAFEVRYMDNETLLLKPAEIAIIDKEGADE